MATDRPPAVTDSDPGTGVPGTGEPRGRAGLLRSSGWAGLVTVAGGGLGLGVEALVARWCGSEAYGAYAWVANLVALALLPALLGSELTVGRFAAVYRARADAAWLRALFAWAGRRVLALAAGAALAGLAVLTLLGGRLEPELRWTLAAGAALLPVAALLRLRQSALLGLGFLVTSRLPELIGRPLLQGLFLLVVYRLGNGLTGAQALGGRLVAAALLLVAASLAVRANLPRPAPGGPPPEAARRRWSRTARPLLLISVLRSSLVHTDVLLVGLLVGVEAAGIYAVAARLAAVVAFGLQAVNSVNMPQIAALFAADRKRRLQRLVSHSAWIALVPSALTALTLVLGRGPILGLFGEPFRAGGAILVVLATGQLANALTGPAGAVLKMTGHEADNARILLVAALSNLLLSPPAILLLGPLGAALTTALLVAARNAATWWVARRRLGINASVLPG